MAWVARAAADMLDELGVGQILLGDRACDSGALRARMAEQGAWANVKPMPNRKQVPAFSPFLYTYRNLVERFFSKTKHFPAVATHIARFRRRLPFQGLRGARPIGCSAQLKSGPYPVGELGSSPDFAE